VAGLGETRGSYQSGRWRQQSCSGGERRRPATASWRFGRATERHGALGEGQQEGVKAVGELGGDPWRPGEAGGLGRRGTVASDDAAARQRGSRVRRKGRGAPGAEV
jgi:hypothetical protein